jgi:acyl-CoA thioesterase II
MSQPAAKDATVPTSLAQALELTPLSGDVFLAPAVGDTGRLGMFGGQLVAQAIRAAAHTVPNGRIVHSMHAYFLRPGSSREPIVFRVHRDPDGGRYSTRRVVVSQGSEICSLTASFVAPKDGPEFQASEMPQSAAPEQLPVYQLDARRTFDLEARLPDDPQPWHRWPTRLWGRIREPLGEDPNIHACALMFLSDMGTGLSKAPAVNEVGILPSLDHAVWLHRQFSANDWMLLDLSPEATAGGRGIYSGRVFDRAGTLLATLAQESLFDRRRPAPSDFVR